MSNFPTEEDQGDGEGAAGSSPTAAQPVQHTLSPASSWSLGTIASIHMAEGESSSSDASGESDNDDSVNNEEAELDATMAGSEDPLEEAASGLLNELRALKEDHERAKDAHFVSLASTSRGAWGGGDGGWQRLAGGAQMHSRSR